MALDYVRRIAADSDAFNYIRVKRPLRQKLVAAVLVCAVLFVLGQ